MGWTARGLTTIEADNIFEAAAKAPGAIVLKDARGLEYDVSNEQKRTLWDDIVADESDRRS